MEDEKKRIDAWINSLIQGKIDNTIFFAKIQKKLESALDIVIKMLVSKKHLSPKQEQTIKEELKEIVKASNSGSLEKDDIERCQDAIEKVIFFATFDVPDGPTCFTRCLSAAIKDVKGSKVIMADSGDKVDQFEMEGTYLYYGRYLSQSNRHWVGLEIKENRKLIFRINKDAVANIDCQGRTFSHFDVVAHLPSYVNLKLKPAEFDTLAAPLTSDADRIVIIKDFLEEVKSIVG